METLKTVTKFEINNKILYVKVLWKPTSNDLFHVKIYDDDKSWSGKFSNEDVHIYKDCFDETEDEYFTNAMKGLSRDHGFSYCFDLEDNNTAKFKWQKKFEDLDAIVDHGVVSMQRDEVPELKDILIDDLLAENDNLKNSVHKINEKNKELSLELDKCKNYLNEFKDMKTSLENNLYGKFVQLLNAKKRRIQLLEENISKIAKSSQFGDEVD